MERENPTAKTVEEDLRRIEGYLRGDPKPFEEIETWILTEIDRRFAPLRVEREDLCQTVHARLVGNLRAGRFRHLSSLHTYVASVSANVAIDVLRRRHREVSLDAATHGEPMERSPGPYEVLAGEDRVQLLHRALISSPEGCRELWRMVFLDRLSYVEIGRRLGIPPGTVKSRMWHCRKRAREIFQRLTKTPASGS